MTIKAKQGLGALSFHRPAEGRGGLRGTLYNDFNPLNFDPRGRRWKNSTGVDSTAVGVWRSAQNLPVTKKNTND